MLATFLKINLGQVTVGHPTMKKVYVQYTLELAELLSVSKIRSKSRSIFEISTIL